MAEIDQILIRRVGGWVLITPADWIRMTATEQAGLLDQHAVQFFAAGGPVDQAEAVAALEPAPQPAPPPPLIASRSDEETTELVAVRPARALYRRAVVDGPAYEIQREAASGEVAPLHVHRRRQEEYDLHTATGPDLLAADLIADALGATEPAELGTRALRYFRSHFYETRLGNRVWSVDAGEIREHVNSNPHLRIVTTGG